MRFARFLDGLSKEPSFPLAHTLQSFPLSDSLPDVTAVLFPLAVAQSPALDFEALLHP
jgi:hypothetical protein